jgi:hypothetical protein
LPAITLPSFDAEAYVASMLRLKALKPKLLVYSHLAVSHQPEKDIQAAIDNTAAFGEIVREAMTESGRQGEQALFGCVREKVRARFGITLGDYEVGANTRAFVDYFQRRAQV